MKYGNKILALSYLGTCMNVVKDLTTYDCLSHKETEQKYYKIVIAFKLVFNMQHLFVTNFTLNEQMTLLFFLIVATLGIILFHV